MDKVNVSITAMINNTFTYHAPTSEQVCRYGTLRDKAKELAHCINENCPDSEQKMTALQKLQETIMWANASIAINEDKKVRNFMVQADAALKQSVLDPENQPHQNCPVDSCLVVQELKRQLSPGYASLYGMTVEQLQAEIDSNKEPTK